MQIDKFICNVYLNSMKMHIGIYIDDFFYELNVASLV